MTKEDWKELEKYMRYPGATAHLLVDGYNVDLQVQVDKMQMLIAVFIDGKFKGKWLSEDCEIRRKFAHRSKRSIISKKEFAKRTKGLSKAVKDELQKNNTYYSYMPYFSSINALKRHLTANNESIELVKLGV